MLLIRRWLHVVRVRRQAVFCAIKAEELTQVEPEVDIELSQADWAYPTEDGGIITAQRRDSFDTFLRDGQTGLIAACSGDVVGYGWAIRAKECATRANRYFDIPPGEALIHHCYVHDDQRGRHIYPHVISELASKLLREMGVTRVWIDSSVRNRASLAGIRRAGFQFVEKAVFIEVAGRRILHLKWPAFTAHG